MRSLVRVESNRLTAKLWLSENSLDHHRSIFHSLNGSFRNPCQIPPGFTAVFHGFSPHLTLGCPDPDPTQNQRGFWGRKKPWLRVVAVTKPASFLDPLLDLFFAFMVYMVFILIT